MTLSSNFEYNFLEKKNHRQPILENTFVNDTKNPDV